MDYKLAVLEEKLRSTSTEQKIGIKGTMEVEKKEKKRGPEDLIMRTPYA